MHAKTLLRLAIASLAIACASAASAADAPVVKVGKETNYRASHQIDASKAPEGYVLQVSANLEEWTEESLVLDASSVTWKVDSAKTDISIVYQKEATDGIWTIEIELPTGTEAYTRVIPAERS